ncbi:MAG: archaellin/type IV pilin N-terminal domain-containing protein [Methanomassiliicoccales archaeon]
MLAKAMKMKKNKRGEMGVGTMIIFIAMILVAAVAASVLISTANTVREQAQSTGEDAIANVASGFIIQGVIGEVADNEINTLTVYVKLAAGSPAIDMSKVIIVYTDGSSVRELQNDTDVSETTYTSEPVPPGTWEYGRVASGVLMKITIGDDLALAPGTHVLIKIMPQNGQPTVTEFTTPETYGADYIILR